jgi:hypothetical protein
VKYTSNPVFGYTQPHDGIANVLISDIFVSEAYDPQSGLQQPEGKPFKGIWDTGASCTIINSRIISELGLQPSGRTKVSAVGDGGKVNEYLTDTYYINVALPNKVIMVGVVAAKGELSGGDALLGMDIISSGDFAVTNVGRKTKLSFRTPSVEEIDFVKEIQEFNSHYGQVNLSSDEKRRRRNRRKAGKKKHR